MKEIYISIILNIITTIFSIVLYIFIKNHDKILKEYLGDSNVAEYIDNAIDSSGIEEKFDDYAKKYAETLVPPQEYIERIINQEEDESVEVITYEQEKLAEQRRRT